MAMGGFYVTFHRDGRVTLAGTAVGTWEYQAGTAPPVGGGERRCGWYLLPADGAAACGPYRTRGQLRPDAKAVRKRILNAQYGHLPVAP
jgi:hypothetical protein